MSVSLRSRPNGNPATPTASPDYITDVWRYLSRLTLLQDHMNRIKKQLNEDKAMLGKLQKVPDTLKNILVEFDKFRGHNSSLLLQVKGNGKAISALTAKVDEHFERMTRYIESNDKMVAANIAAIEQNRTALEANKVALDENKVALEENKAMLKRLSERGL